MTCAKRGPEPDPFRSHMRRQFEEWSDRTFATWWHAFILLTELRNQGFLTEAEVRECMTQSHRPNGTINVSKFARIADEQVMRAIRPPCQHERCWYELRGKCLQ